MFVWLCGLLLAFSVSGDRSTINELSQLTVRGENLQLILQEILIKNMMPYRCVVIISDSTYFDLFENAWFKRFGAYISFVIVRLDDSEDPLIPSTFIVDSLHIARANSCQMYIVLIANGIQTTRLLNFGERYRLVDTRAQFIFLYDNRLFHNNMFYVWKKLINVVFIKEYSGKRRNEMQNIPWFEMLTVPFPAPITNILVPKRLDIWTQMKFRKGIELFKDKTIDLKNQTLKVVTFSHVPATRKVLAPVQPSERTSMSNENGSLIYTGVEVEILQAVSTAMNFRCDIYEAENADTELWGRRIFGNKYSGIIGEIIETKADIALGDIYYTPYFLDLMDLSTPYNTECLTFLTPEALTDNSWKTLILPFKPTMWGAVLVCLFICCLVFHALARFHHYMSYREHTEGKSPLHQKKKRVMMLSTQAGLENINPDVKYIMLKEQYNKRTYEGQPIGLYQFSEPFNSVLYTYSMLLLVSLPKLPSGWSLRMLTGWYWLYCLLVVVAYRASMTAILARPAPRVTIDTLQQLVDSRLACGSWGEINQQFFKTSPDTYSKIIGENFENVNNSEEAVDRVAQGVFAFYENVQFLKDASVKRQLRYHLMRTNSNMTNQTQETRNIAEQDRNLHIMSDCVIKMPISIGLQKNSPLKPRVDKYIRRVTEAGLVKKWLDDVMQIALNNEIQTTQQEKKALMNMKKFFGALVALVIGYVVSIIALIIEIVYFRYLRKKQFKFKNYFKLLYRSKKVD